MKKNIRVLLVTICILISLLVLFAIGLAVYRTTPHYTLRHEHYADVTLDDGTVVRFLRYEQDESGKRILGQAAQGLDLKEIRFLASNTIVIPSYVGGFPVTSIGAYAMYSIGTPGGEYPSAIDLSKIKSITLPDTLTNVFYLNAGPFTELESLHIGKAISDMLWIDSRNLREITVDPKNARYKLENGCLIDKNTNTVILETVEK